MRIGDVIVRRSLPNNLLVLVNKAQKKINWLIILANYPVVVKDLGETLPFLRALGRKGLVFFCRLSKFEIVFDSNFYKPEKIVGTDTEWVWGHMSNQTGLMNKKVQIGIIYRGYVPKYVRLRFKVIHPSKLECLFNVDQVFPAVCFSESKSYFDRKVKLNPGMNLFELKIHFDEVFFGSDGRPISFGLTNYHVSHRSKLWDSNELLIRKDLHIIGYESVYILRLGQGFSTYSKNFEGDPEDFWQKSSTKKTLGRLGLIVARSSGER